MITDFMLMVDSNLRVPFDCFLRVRREKKLLDKSRWVSSRPNSPGAQGPDSNASVIKHRISW
jgi:hypothetical protein